MEHDVELVSGTPVTLLVGGKLYKAGMLTALDFAECSTWKAQQQAQALYNMTGGVPGADNAAIKSDAISKILTKSFEPRELLGDTQCVLRLAEISIRRGGEWKGSFEVFKKQMDTASYRDLELLVLKMSGYWSKEIEASVSSPNPPQPTV